MSPFRRYLSLSAAALLSFATAALAESPVDSANVSRAEDEMSSLICHAALCETDQDCQALCPTAQTATCVAYACEYTYSGGGGGGGGGPVCHAQFCTDDWECECNGRQGYCGSDSVCYF